MSALLRPPAWTADAACLGMTGRGRDPWSPDDDLTPTERAAEYALARRICAFCPVRHECALDALNNAIPHGMFGGLTPADRRSLARATGHEPPGAAQHGTRSRYVAGCRCGDCKRAHRIYAATRRAITRDRPAREPPYLTAPAGRGRSRAYPGQYLLINHSYRIPS